MTGDQIKEVLESVIDVLRKQNTRTSRRIASLLNLAIILIDELEND